MRPNAQASAPAAAAIRGPIGQPPQQKVDRARAWIETHPDGRPSLARLARVAGASPWHLQRTFKRLLGVTPAEYAQARRAARLKTELKRGPVTDAIYAAGFGSPSRVYDEATGVLGMTPRAYRAGGRGEQIRFTTLTTRLGAMLVAATDRGLCQVALGDDPSMLEQRLREEFPAADVRRDRAGLEPAIVALRAAAAGQPIHSPLPLDVRATAFQRRVWRALQDDSGWADPHLRRGRTADWQASVGQGRRQGLRHQPGRPRRPMPSRRPGRWAAPEGIVGAAKERRSCWRMRPEMPAASSAVQRRG